MTAVRWQVLLEGDSSQALSDDERATWMAALTDRAAAAGHRVVPDSMTTRTVDGRLLMLEVLVEERATAAGISTGDYVSWQTSGGKAKGRVVSIHTDSTVPNAPTKVQGTVDDPAARINVHEPHPDGGWRPTDQHVAHKVSALTKIDPLPAPPAKQGAPTIPISMIGHGGTVTLSAAGGGGGGGTRSEVHPAAPTAEQRPEHENALRAWLDDRKASL